MSDDVTPKLVINSQVVWSIVAMFLSAVGPALITVFSQGHPPTVAEVIGAVIAALGAYFGIKGRIGATQQIQGVLSPNVPPKPLTFVKGSASLTLLLALSFLSVSALIACSSSGPSATDRELTACKLSLEACLAK